MFKSQPKKCLYCLTSGVTRGWPWSWRCGGCSRTTYISSRGNKNENMRLFSLFQTLKDVSTNSVIGVCKCKYECQIWICWASMSFTTEQRLNEWEKWQIWYNFISAIFWWHHMGLNSYNQLEKYILEHLYELLVIKIAN